MSGPDRLPFRLRVCLRLIRMASSLAPRVDRADLTAQWEADLLHRWQKLVSTEAPGKNERIQPGGGGNVAPTQGRVGAPGRPESTGPLRAGPPPAHEFFLWSLGAFKHAWYLFRTEYTMDSIWQDVKYGIRSLNRSRGIIAIAILSLAVGIGANASIFSAVDVFMLRPLPYPDSDRLQMVWVTNPDRGWGRVSFTAPDFLDLRDQSESMGLAATLTGVFNLSGDFDAERLRGAYVTPGFFSLLQVQPVHGRGFTDEEGVPGNEHVAVISHELWQQRFGGDPEMVGETIILDGLPHTCLLYTSDAADESSRV